MRLILMCGWTIALIASLFSRETAAFAPPSSIGTSCQRFRQVALHVEPPKEGPFDFLFDPYQSTMPKEIRDEIYKAEANTQAAKDRGKRVAIYIAIAIMGILGAFFNGFLTELRFSTSPDEIPFVMEESPFAWVLSSFVTKFFFMNKIGGVTLLLLGAGSGLVAEAELDSKRVNAEKIWTEMQKRRSKAEKQKTTSPKKKKRQSIKNDKRFDALAEVMTTSQEPSEATEASFDRADSEDVSTAKELEEKPGIFGAVKEFYKKADNLAASQALLLNKELEDRGVVEKITDESGLRVIGKEKAAELLAKTETGKNEK
jgi:hypothetical protein